ncbi:MAG: hypothetical protein R2690_14980 [Acidimicrobiales bacterium]
MRALVVDNGSAAAELDAARAVVASAPIDARLFEAGTNTGFGPGANIGLRAWLAEGVGERAAVVPHDALPDPGALAALIAMAAAQHHVGLACADVGDGETPVVDLYFGGMTVPARRRRMGAGRLPARHAAAGPARLPGSDRSVRRAVLRLLRGGGPRRACPGRRMAGRPGAGAGDQPDDAVGQPGRGLPHAATPCSWCGKHPVRTTPSA